MTLQIGAIVEYYCTVYNADIYVVLILLCTVSHLVHNARLIVCIAVSR